MVEVVKVGWTLPGYLLLWPFQLYLILCVQIVLAPSHGACQIGSIGFIHIPHRLVRHPDILQLLLPLVQVLRRLMLPFI